MRNNLFRNCPGATFCRKKNRLVAEYALRGLDQSIAVAAWQTQLTESLPDELRGSLPAIEEIEAEPGRDLPPAEDVKKVERRLASEEKKSLKKPDVLKKDTKP